MTVYVFIDDDCMDLIYNASYVLPYGEVVTDGITVHGLTFVDVDSYLVDCTLGMNFPQENNSVYATQV